MSPSQPGEVFVTDDGAETDLDLGHYERFTGRPANRMDNVTTGRIYQDIIARERRGGSSPGARGLHPPDADALHRDGRRAEDQADAALGQGAPLDRYPARYSPGPL